MCTADTITGATNEICAPLTPSRVMCSKQLLSQLSNEHIDDNYETSNKKCINRIRYLQKLLEHFLERFQKEYLNALLDQRRYNQRQ